jgi:DNA-binding ferritin-like protein
LSGASSRPYRRPPPQANVVGLQFHDLHKFFQEQYEALDHSVDEIAERATQVGGHAVGTLAEFVQLARLKEHPAHYPDAREMLANLLADHEAIIRTCAGIWRRPTSSITTWGRMTS